MCRFAAQVDKNIPSTIAAVASSPPCNPLLDDVYACLCLCVCVCVRALELKYAQRNLSGFRPLLPQPGPGYLVLFQPASFASPFFVRLTPILPFLPRSTARLIDLVFCTLSQLLLLFSLLLLLLLLVVKESQRTHANAHTHLRTGGAVALQTAPLHTYAHGGSVHQHETYPEFGTVVSYYFHDTPALGVEHIHTYTHTQ